MTGISNGGYLTRWQLENQPELYDGGVDWEGTLWRADGPEPADRPAGRRREDPRTRGARPTTTDLLAAGFAPGSEFLWPYHDGVYWDLTQRIYREEFDPAYDGAARPARRSARAARPACDADYDYARPASRRHRAVARVALTGRIGKPHDHAARHLDTLLPIATDSDVYARMVARPGPRRAAPLLPRRGRQPHRRALRHLPGPAAARSCPASALPSPRSRPGWKRAGLRPRTARSGGPRAVTWSIPAR